MKKSKKTSLMYAILIALILICGAAISVLVFNEFSQYTSTTYRLALSTTAPATSSDFLDCLLYAEETFSTEPPTLALTPFIPECEYVTAWRKYYNNEDIIGHLRIPGTAIDYILVQSTDNTFYLYHNIRREECPAGWVFFDYYIDLGFVNQNLVIYAHNMRDGSKFHNLRYFAQYDFFRKNNLIYLHSIYRTSVWEIFAFYEAHISFPYTYINLPIDYWLIMQEAFVAASIHQTDIVLKPHDRVLTLSTCSNVDRDTRYVLQARLFIPPWEIAGAVLDDRYANLTHH